MDIQTWQPLSMYFEFFLLPLLYLDMHISFQLKKLLVYQLILSVSKKYGI
jgi:hypothetical protein